MLDKNDLTFFTNEPESTLLDRFISTLKDTQYFDILVGYFRTSGFFRLYESFEPIDKIRILVGLDADKKTIEIIEESNQTSIDFETNLKTKEKYSAYVVNELEKSEDSFDVELGVKKFIEFLQSGKLEIRAYPSKDIHAKVYFSDKKLILGSSNFSANGLSLEGAETNKLIEANVLIDNQLIINQTSLWFNSLWNDAQNIDEKYCQKFIPKWAKRRVITGRQIAEPDFFKAYENGVYNDENLYIIVDIGGFTAAEEKIGDKIAKETFSDDLFYKGKEISYWYGYKTVPRDKHIINYFFESDGKLIYYGIWKTLPKNYDTKNWQFCYKDSEKLIMKKHITQITAILKKNKENLRLASDGLEMKLSDFYKMFRSTKAK